MTLNMKGIYALTEGALTERRDRLLCVGGVIHHSKHHDEKSES
jgi:hypothetical protein